MAIVLKLDNEDRLSLREFADHLETTFDLEEADSLIGVAPHFRSLANDPNLVAHHFNAEIQSVLDAKSEPRQISSPFVIASGRNYALHAKIWMPDAQADVLRPSSGSVAGARHAHNHNFNVMTIGYFGPGHVSDLYTFTPNEGSAHIGDRVDLRFTERVRIQKQCAVICRDTVDAHAHIAPEALSISMSLSIFSGNTQVADRFVFDPQASTICGYVDTADVYQRASVVRLAGEVGNEQTLELFDALLRRSPSQRVREAALAATARLPHIEVAERVRVIQRALKDSDESLRLRAKTLIDQIADPA
ncbi:MAG TPA: HEAT repeat domain-containing protein [Rudaea sp.]|jgi:hypothetical protein|nr:HEAT repeat domain-containing protein [Rudaea sp.]